MTNNVTTPLLPRLTCLETWPTYRLSSRSLGKYLNLEFGQEISIEQTLTLDRYTFYLPEKLTPSQQQEISYMVSASADEVKVFLARKAFSKMEKTINSTDRDKMLNQLQQLEDLDEQVQDLQGALEYKADRKLRDALDKLQADLKIQWENVSIKQIEKYKINFDIVKIRKNIFLAQEKLREKREDKTLRDGVYQWSQKLLLQQIPLVEAKIQSTKDDEDKKALKIRLVQLGVDSIKLGIDSIKNEPQAAHNDKRRQELAQQILRYKEMIADVGDNTRMKELTIKLIELQILGKLQDKEPLQKELDKQQQGLAQLQARRARKNESKPEHPQSPVLPQTSEERVKKLFNLPDDWEGNTKSRLVGDGVTQAKPKKM